MNTVLFIVFIVIHALLMVGIVIFQFHNRPNEVSKEFHKSFLGIFLKRFVP